jgi:hypothetical protein
MKTLPLEIYSLIVWLFYIMSTMAALSVGQATSLEVLSVDPQEVAVSEKRAILEDSALRVACLIGSMMGAVLSATIFPIVADTTPKMTRLVAVRILSSLIGGVIFTPIILRYLGISVDVDLVVGISGLVAFMSVAVLSEMAVPAVGWLVSEIKKRVGITKT